jgi:hypothetical protein
MPRNTYHSDPGAPCGRGCVAVDRIHNELSAERWVFYFYAETNLLALDNYYRLSKATKRHRWKIEESYSRLASSRDASNMTNPPLPEDIKHEAWKNFTKTIRVGRWEER